MIPFIDYPFVWLQDTIGVPKDELKLIFTILLSYPLAGVLKRLPDTEPAKKNLFMIGVSLFYLIGVFSLWSGIRTLLIASSGAYCIAAFVQGPYMPWVSFVFLMGHMLVGHIHREMYPQPGVVDVTGAQMVLVMKLTAFCWSVHDGRLPKAELSEFQQDRALPEMPSLLDYAGYVLFFPSLFAGPAFDFAEYRRWIDCSMFDVVIPDTKRGGTKRKRKIPSSSIPATIKAVKGLAWIFLFLKFSSWYTTEFALSDQFLEYGIFKRIWYIYLLSFTARLKYYGAWYLTEGACILSGLGYNGLDEKKQPRWDRLTNVGPLALETAQNTRAYLENWNMNTNKWLKNYVYLRVTPKGKKPGFRSSMATFGTSAIWHGISPGYYLTFITASFVQTVAKYFRRHVRPFFMTADQKSDGPYKKIYDVFGLLVTQFSFAYIVAPFIILDFKDSLKLWSRAYFFVHIGIFVSLGFFNSPGKQWLQQRLKNKVGRAAARELHKSASSENFQSGSLGVPDDPIREIEDIQMELQAKKEEILKRRATDRMNKAKKQK
ncbi:MBOAT-domain-containing protein [Morchella conica CCBAS932]|uniref:MBOAT-domain-containing protein n=1 Tax=Morchella conica CCBAS932 TaxID=1392247 RepID=A0A3N4KZQ5_9PEZI|nr:MBOAT-domain-containing protein [Morchella conica CCBAS932]